MSEAVNKTLNIGICGLGTVGGGTLALLTDNADEIRRRLGSDIKVTRIATRTLDGKDLYRVETVSTDVFDVVNDVDIDILIETIGGYDPALDVIKQALSKGKHVVTANKALIAEHGLSLIHI